MTVLRLDPIPLKDIPDIQTVLAEAKTLIQDIPNWTEGKVYRGVRTHKKPMDGPAWHSRTSIHGSDDGTFEEFWNCLGVNHSLNEKEYVPEVNSAQLLASFEGFEGKKFDAIPVTHLMGSWIAWTMGYRFTPPVSNRTFTVLIACVLEESQSRQGFVLSLPLDVSEDQTLAAQEPRGVRGRYISVERVKEVEGKVEWTMATRSDPGGLIPSFISELTMPGKISEDVPHAIDWIQTKRASSG